MDDEEEFVRAGHLRMESGTILKVFPLLKISLGQAIVLVVEGKVYCLEAAWDGMTDNDRERFRQAAAKGASWIDRREGAPVIQGPLARGGRWCAHIGFSPEDKQAARDPDAIAFGAVRPSRQSAGTVVVGGSTEDNARYCGTCEGATEASRQCSPNTSEFGKDDFSVETERREAAEGQLKREEEEKQGREADRQLRMESIEPDTGAEDWMTLGRKTVFRVTELTEALENKQGLEESGKGRDKGERERWMKLEEWMTAMTKENQWVRKELESLKEETRESRRGMEKYWDWSKGKAETDEGNIRGSWEIREAMRKVKRALATMEEDGKRRVGNIQSFLTRIMETLTKVLVNHNVSREDHKMIYREISTLEAAMGSTVRSATAGEVAGLRLELKKIFNALAEDTPRQTPHIILKKTRGDENEGSRSVASREQSSSSDSESDRGGGNPSSGSARPARRAGFGAGKDGLTGTIGGKRGPFGGSGIAGNPINLVTPALAKIEPTSRKGILTRKQSPSHREVAQEREGRAREEGKLEEGIKMAPTATEGGQEGGMQGQWDTDSITSLDPTPNSGLTEPRRDLIPVVIGAVRDELTIGFIANCKDVIYMHGHNITTFHI